MGKLLFCASLADPAAIDSDREAVVDEAQAAEEALAAQIDAIGSSVTALSEEVGKYRKATKETGCEIKRAVVNVAARADAVK